MKSITVTLFTLTLILVHTAVYSSDRSNLISQYKKNEDPYIAIRIAQSYESERIQLENDVKKAQDEFMKAALSGTSDVKVLIAASQKQDKLKNEFFNKNLPKKEFKWFSIGAKSGDNYSMIRLSRMYSAGKGINKDYQMAYVWGVLGGEISFEMEKLLSKMGVIEVLEAEKITRKCRRSNYTDCY